MPDVVLRFIFGNLAFNPYIFDYLAGVNYIRIVCKYFTSVCNKLSINAICVMCVYYYEKHMDETSEWIEKFFQN